MTVAIPLFTNYWGVILFLILSTKKYTLKPIFSIKLNISIMILSIMILFVNRDEELCFLQERFDSKRSEFIIIYGRRRIGKTELIKEFIKEKNSFYFIAKKQDLELERKRFIKNFAKQFKIYIEGESWEDIFNEIATIGKTKRFIIVIDEFSYWMEKDPTMTSTLQVLWDEQLKNTRCFLILCGSIIGVMESILTYRNPLYGRRTGQWKMGPLSIFHLKKFFPTYTWEEIIQIYGCVGGIPQYILEFNPGRSVIKNIEHTFLNKGNILYEDAERLLKDELREPIVYLNILECINDGTTTLSEIAGKTKVNITNLPKYLKILASMNLLKKEFPVTVHERKIRKGLYKLSDNYFKFWLRFISPFKEEIELGTYQFQRHENAFNQYLGSIFEEASQQLLVQLNKKKKTPFPFTTIGTWWFKDKEIDIVALNDHTKEIAFIECEWSHVRKKDADRLLRELQEKSTSVQWLNNKRKNYFGIIAKKIEKKEELRAKGFIAYDLADFSQI